MGSAGVDTELLRQLPVVPRAARAVFIEGGWMLSLDLEACDEGDWAVTEDYASFYRLCTGEQYGRDALGCAGPRLQAMALKEPSRLLADALAELLEAAPLPPPLSLVRKWAGRATLGSCVMTHRNRPSLASWEGWPWDLHVVLRRAARPRFCEVSIKGASPL